MSDACETPSVNAAPEEVRALLEAVHVIAVVGLSDKPERDSYHVAAYLQSRGYRWGTPEAMAKMARREPVEDNLYYMRTVPKFEAPAGKYDWLNRYVFVGRAEKTPEGNRIHYFKVL